MGVSFSRVDPTQPEGERRAGRVVRVGESSIVTECSVRTRSAARRRHDLAMGAIGGARMPIVRMGRRHRRVDGISPRDVKARRASPLCPSVAKTMARVLGLVKSRQKKIGACWPRIAASQFKPKGYVRRILSGRELRSARSARSALIDRTAPSGHADQEDRHGSSGKQGELRIVPAAERTGDS
jgi:hypothetical protein